MAPGKAFDQIVTMLAKDVVGRSPVAAGATQPFVPGSILI
jgi:hypothetical protein